MKPDPLTDDQLDAMTQVQRIAYFKSLNLGHNAAIRIGCATTPEGRAWEIRLARGERAAAVADDPNEVQRLEVGDALHLCHRVELVIG